MSYVKQQWADDVITAPYGPVSAARLGYMEDGIYSAHGLAGGGGLSSSTPGTVTTVNIAHNLGIVPTTASLTPANANAANAPNYHLTLNATNIVVNFVSALTVATQYDWYWQASLGS